MIERVRTITRRSNPQPFFNLFRPVVRASSENAGAPRDDENGSEAQTLTQPDCVDATECSDDVKVEVCGFPEIRKGANFDDRA